MNTPNLQPKLSGKLVALRPVLKQDWQEMFSAAADPAIWASHPDRSRYKESNFRTYFNEAITSGSALSIIERSTGSIIGSSRYHGYDPEAREIEIGWTFLARKFWGGAFNGEAKHLMLTHAFSFVDIVVFWIAQENMRSRRAMDKIGGVLRKGLQTRSQGDVSHPYVIYEIQKADFIRQSPISSGKILNLPLVLSRN